MPFGWVTRAQLDAKADELRKEIAAGLAFEEEMKYEWALWFNKFRSLYATLLKREKKVAKDDAGETNGDELVSQEGGKFRSRRGF